MRIERRKQLVVLGLVIGLHLLQQFSAFCADPQQRPMDVKKWHLALQRMASTYQPGKTKEETDARRKALVEQLKETQEGLIVEFRTTIKDINWEDGIAKLTVDPMLSPPRANNRKMPLRIEWMPTYEVLMTREQASSVKPGMKFGVRANLEFHPNRVGAVGKDTRSQQLLTLYHEQLGGSALGTYTTTQCELFIDGKPAQGRWAPKPDAAPSDVGQKP